MRDQLHAAGPATTSQLDPQAAPVAQGNLAGRLMAPSGTDRGIRTVNADRRMFTMWKKTIRKHQRQVVGEYYTIARLPVSRRHNGAEGVFTDYMTNRLVHVPTHWARKGWKLAEAPEDLAAWCKDPQVYPNGIQPLPSDWQEHNRGIDERTAALSLESSPDPAHRARTEQLQDLAQLVLAATGSQSPLSGTGTSFTDGGAEALAEAAEALEDSDKAKLVKMLAPKKGGKQ